MSVTWIGPCGVVLMFTLYEVKKCRTLINWISEIMLSFVSFKMSNILKTCENQNALVNSWICVDILVNKYFSFFIINAGKTYKISIQKYFLEQRNRFLNLYSNSYITKPVYWVNLQWWQRFVLIGCMPKYFAPYVEPEWNF